MKTSTSSGYGHVPQAQRNRFDATFGTHAGLPKARDVEAIALSNLQDDPISQRVFSRIRKVGEMIAGRWKTGGAEARDRRRGV